MMRQFIDLITEGWKDEKSKIDAIDGQRWDHLEELFASKGFVPIGNGLHGRVYGSDTYPYVVKLFRNDAAYEAFLSFAAQNPNPHYAKARGKVKTISDEGDYRIIRLEKLLPASKENMVMYRDSMQALAELKVISGLEEIDDDDFIASFVRETKYGFKSNAEQRQRIADLQKKLSTMNPSFVDAMKIIVNVFSDSNIGALDTNAGNVMQRPDGTPVIIDPLQPRR